MRELAKPYWIFLTVTLPQSALLFLYAGSYRIISTLMKKDNIFNWKLYGALLVLLLCVATVYGIVVLIRRRTIDAKYGIFIFLTYLPLLYVFLYNADNIIPFDIPRWMLVGEDLLLYAFTFLMPAFGHALVLLVLRLTPEEKDHKLQGSIIGAVLVPASWYLWVNIGMPLLRGRLSGKFFEHAFLILIITSTIVFLFFVVRLVYLILLKKPLATYRRAYVYKVFFAVVLPVLCFAVYNGLIPQGAEFRVARFLGDVSHPWYYIVVAVNGILLSLPGFKSRALRLALFFSKSAAYPFVFYFFLALLPFLPLSIPAIIAFGLGFLMLTPLMVMVIHTQSLTDDYTFLKEHYAPGLIVTIFLAGILVLPAGVTATFMHDRATLNRMLDFVYNPDFSHDTSAAINRSAAERTLRNIKANKQGRLAAWEDRKPYITPFYQWLVLDNMTLSNQKMQVLEKIFWGVSDVKVPEGRDNSGRGPRPVISVINTESHYSENKQFSRSWVHLTLKNGTTEQQEYMTSFRLPAGAWISDYYLKIGNETVHGMLADKKSATWVYQQVMNERKDPGILYYTDNGEIALRVFPFASHETRSTGFEIIHRDPVQIEIDHRRITLAGPGRSGQDQETAAALRGDVVFISKSAKTKLPKFIRKPYYHFILDCSVGTEQKREGYIDRINRLLDRRLMDAGNARISLANFRIDTVDLNDKWEEKVRQFPAQGGFYLERALKMSLFRHYEERARSYPIFVVVSDNLRNAVFTDGMSGFSPTFPETDVYYELDASGRVYSHPLTAPPSKPKGINISRIPVHHVLVWPDSKEPLEFLSDNGEAGILLKKSDLSNTAADLSGPSWENGLTLQGMWMSMQLQPSKTEKLRLSILRNSFRTHIMTPLMSFIVLENEAQRQAMKRKQERVLSAHKALDIGEEREMAEPSLRTLLILLLLMWAFNVLKKRRKKATESQEEVS